MYFISYKKNLPLEIRSKFALSNKKYPIYFEKLKEYFKESLIINTCNRTEVYIVPKDNINIDDILDYIFEVFNWDNNLKDYISIKSEDATIKHLMEVACGFHSKILGEDQILSQIKDSLKLARENKACGEVLQKLFLTAITCGKKFRSCCKLNEIPVSISSISAKKAIEEGCFRVLVIGFGEIGELTLKYLLESNRINKVYILVRDLSKIEALEDERVEFIDYSRKNEVIKEVNGIISCTSAPHYVVKEEDIPKDRSYSMFDLAVPRDIDEALEKRDNIKVYDVDTLSTIDYENKRLREQRINNNKYIVKEFIEEFNNWKRLKKVFPIFSNMNDKKNVIVNERIKSFMHKKNTKDVDELAATLMESVAKAYVNRAIEVLKEEAMQGRENECMEIMKRIFL